MNIRRVLPLLAAASALLTPCLASAQSTQTWDVASGFNAAPWSYMQRSGTGCTGAATPLAYPYAGPAGTNFVGRQGVNTPTIVPLVAKNLAATGTTVYSSAQIPAGAVWLHPGETGVNPQCAVVRFKAPMAGKYRIKGWIKSVDVGANKVNGYLLVNGTPVAGAGPIALSGPMGTQQSFDTVVTIVGMPRDIDFALDDGGSYFNDSTQLNMTITRCPTRKGGGKDKGPRADQGDGNGDKECLAGDVR